MINENVFNIVGEVTDFGFSYSIKEIKFYKAVVKVSRLSGTDDVLPIIISESTFKNNGEINVGDILKISGEVRMKNRDRNEKHNIYVYGYAFSYSKLTLKEYSDEENKNSLKIEGYICKEPRNRQTTKTSRMVCDLLVACNRPKGKTYYLPTIAWGTLSKKASKLKVGDKIVLEGRFQSRTYSKMNDEGEYYDYSVQEVSATSITIVKADVA